MLLLLLPRLTEEITFLVLPSWYGQHHPASHKDSCFSVGVATELGNRRQEEEEGGLKMPATEQLAHCSKADTIGTQ